MLPFSPRVLRAQHRWFAVRFMLLITSALLWAISTPELAAANGIQDMPSAMFLALLMLSGQGLPEGDLTVSMKSPRSSAAGLGGRRGKCSEHTLEHPSTP